MVSYLFLPVLVVKVVGLWMEGGLCRGSKEGDLCWFVGMVGFD